MKDWKCTLAVDHQDGCLGPTEGLACKILNNSIVDELELELEELELDALELELEELELDTLELELDELGGQLGHITHCPQ